MTRLVDVDVSLSRWPCRRLPGDDTPALVALLRKAGVSHAWAGSYEALLHRDVEGVNQRLAQECRTHGEGLLVPFGCVNPTLPDWQEDVRRCHEAYGMPGLRLHPNYHGYTLSDPVAAEFLSLAEDRGLIVEIAARMEDVRTQHPRLQVPDVDITPLKELAAARPQLQIVVLGALRSASAGPLLPLIELPNIAFDLAMLEGVGGVGNALRTLPFERLLFGSHAPFFHLESAVLKLRESALGDAVQSAVSAGNAERIFLARGENTAAKSPGAFVP